MATILATRSVGDLAVEAPGAARVFEQMGIDFCCGGTKSLDEACREKGIAVNVVLQAMAEHEQKAGVDAPDRHWRQEPLQSLMTHVVERHHHYVRTETPRIEHWLGKCIAAHGQRHPELSQIQRTFAGMASEMAQHMAKEELILFPAIARAESGHGVAGRGTQRGSAALPASARTGLGAPEPQAGASRPSLTSPVRMMMSEHDDTGRDLATIRKLSADFAVPSDACSTYRTLLQALAEFESDMRQHVHLENNILFPRALAFEDGYHKS